MVRTRRDPKAAVADLDWARLVAPGGLVEEAALRREIALLAEARAAPRVALLTRQYADRFSASPYAPDFFRDLARLIARTGLADDPGNFRLLSEAAARMTADGRRDFLLTLAQARRRSNAQFAAAAAAAGEALRTATPGGPEEARGRLYLDAARIFSDGYDEAAGDLPGHSRRKTRPFRRGASGHGAERRRAIARAAPPLSPLRRPIPATPRRTAPRATIAKAEEALRRTESLAARERGRGRAMTAIASAVPHCRGRDAGSPRTRPPAASGSHGFSAALDALTAGEGKARSPEDDGEHATDDPLGPRRAQPSSDLRAALIGGALASLTFAPTAAAATTGAGAGTACGRRPRGNAPRGVLATGAPAAAGAPTPPATAAAGAKLTAERSYLAPAAFASAIEASQSGAGAGGRRRYGSVRPSRRRRLRHRDGRVGGRRPPPSSARSPAGGRRRRERRRRVGARARPPPPRRPRPHPPPGPVPAGGGVGRRERPAPISVARNPGRRRQRERAPARAPPPRHGRSSESARRRGSIRELGRGGDPTGAGGGSADGPGRRLAFRRGSARWTSFSTSAPARQPAEASPQTPRSDSSTAPSADKVREIDLDLTPGGLDDVTMTVRLTGDKLGVVIRAASGETTATIEGARDAIAERLAAIGQPVTSLIIQQTGASDATERTRPIGGRAAMAARRRGRGARRAIRAALAAALLVSSRSFSRACAGSLACEREMTRAAAETGVPLNVLYSVGLTETGHRGELGPYDMNVDGREVHSETLAEAMARFAAARAQGRAFHRRRLHADQRPFPWGPVRVRWRRCSIRRATSITPRAS